MLRHARLLVPFLTLVSFCHGETDPVTAQFDGSLTVPKYENGYVLDWDAPRYSTLTLYGPDAKLVYTFPLKENHKQLLYDAWAVDTDGTAVRSRHAVQDANQFELLDKSGKVSRTIDTGTYQSTHLTFAPDHSIWTVGFVYGI